MKKKESPELEVRTVTVRRQGQEPWDWHFYSRGLVEALPAVNTGKLPDYELVFEGDEFVPSYEHFYVTFDSPFGISNCHRVLEEVPITFEVDELRALLKEQFADKIDDAKWQHIEAEIISLGWSPMDEDGFVDVEITGFAANAYLLAIWADLACEKLSKHWLAAMALHAHHVLENPYTAGYMCALIDMLEKHEADALRGKRIAESTRRGGAQTASTYEKERAAIVAAMRPLIQKGLSPNAAGRIVHVKHGLGANAEANAKRWTRYLKSLKKQGHS